MGNRWSSRGNESSTALDEKKALHEVEEEIDLTHKCILKVEHKILDLEKNYKLDANDMEASPQVLELQLERAQLEKKLASLHDQQAEIKVSVDKHTEDHPS